MSDESRAAYALTAAVFLVPLIPVALVWYLVDTWYRFPGDDKPTPPGWPLIAQVALWTGFVLTVPVIAIAGNVALVALYFTLVGGP